ncbi:leucine zipper putative tumor suppressor 1-like [Cetorhinus maximus]
MGSVSSLITSQSLQEKQCKALECRSRKASQAHKLIRQQDGLLKFETNQEATNRGPKTSSKCERSEDFFYISISQSNGLRTMGKLKNGAPQRDGPNDRDNQEPPPTLVPYSGQLEKTIEKSIARPTAFKVVAPRNTSANLNCPLESQASRNLVFQGNVLKPAQHSQKHNGREQAQPNYSGTLSDSGRNSMSSLPTLSTGYSCGTDLVAAANLLSRFGGSVQHIGQAACSLDSILRHVTSSTSTSDRGHCPTSKSMNFNQSQPLLPCASCTRTPLGPDQCVHQDPEERLEGDKAELQGTLAEKGAAPLSIYKEKQEKSEQGMDSLAQTDSRAPQRKHYQLLQLQVIQLQQDKTKLQDDFTQLLQERYKLNAKCESYRRDQAELAPKLEETKWEVCQKSGEISLLKQQLKDLQAELTQKAGEVLSLKAQLRDTKGKLSAREEAVEELQNSLRAKERELGVCENEGQRMKNAAELLRGKVSLLERQILDLKQELTSCPEADRAAQADPAFTQADREMPRRPAEPDSAALRGELAGLQVELEQEKLKNQELSSDLQQERLLWQVEKQRVIEYQKKLQQTYIDVLRQNHSLERAIRQLSIQLGARDPVGTEVQNPDVHYEEIIATAI